MIRIKLQHLLLLSLLALNIFTVAAQENWTSWSHFISTKGYEGRPFRMQASVKSMVQDDSASARLWARVDLKSGGSGFFENMWKKPIRSTEWKTYTIEGTIDTAATRLVIGALCELNGKFSFDNFKVEVADNDKKWKTIYSADFDKGLEGWSQGIGFGEIGVNKSFAGNAAIQTGSNKSLVITGTNVPNYGNDKKVGKFASINGIKLYYEIYGQGQPLVVLHGNGGSISSAATHYPELIKKYKVIAIDSRGQGQSTDTDQPMNYDMMASDVNALLDQLHVDSAFFWGQSDGAILGLLMAMDYPKKVKRVIACGANVQPDSSAVYGWAVTAVNRVISTSKDPKEVKLWTMMRDYPHIPYEKLHTIKAPVLIMGGDRDVIRPEHLVKMFQNIPNSQLCILPGTTHGEAWDKKDQFLKILFDFFDKPFTMPDTADWFKE
ncbi:MAG: alpha/beta hydrolase [Ferruginibacter sp.]